MTMETATLSPIADLFGRSTTAFWATTYNVDVRLFSEYLLPRLGAPPINATVLADQTILARGMARIRPDREGGLATVNRRWLLRGVRAGGAAFHPKSYLSVSPGRAFLLVGSGNLSAGGLDDGREVFTAFRSGEPDGDHALATWLGWIRRIVQRQDDPVLDDRLADLESRLVTITTATREPRSTLLHNLDTPLLPQLTGLLAAEGGMPVDELLLEAPFYDAGVVAMTQLMTELNPRRVVVYVTGSTSVDGKALRQALTGREVIVRALRPDRFTHAKLVGVVSGSHGWLLSGSANLSRAALLFAAGRGGNIELGVVTRLSAGQTRSRFVPADATATDRALETLDSLILVDDEEPPGRPVLLRRAEACEDGRVVVVTAPAVAPGWFLVAGTTVSPLVPGQDGSGTSRDPVVGRLVYLADEAGELLSNPVVVDDVVGLVAALGEPLRAEERDLPEELSGIGAEGPLVDVLEMLHRELIMDVAELADSVVRGASGVNPGDEEDDDFWHRLEQEHLAADPRASRYRAPASQADFGDLVLQILEKLRAGLPPAPASLPGRRGGEEPDGDGRAGSRQWSMSARVRVRVRNCMRRLAISQTDPRLRWIDRRAPAINFKVMAPVLAELRVAAAEQRAGIVLTADDVDEIWWLWLQALVGSGRGDGYLDCVDGVERLELLGSFGPDVGEAAALLCWLRIRRGSNQRRNVVTVQDVLLRAIDHGLPAPTPQAARNAAICSPECPTQDNMANDLLSAATFLDDELWCRKLCEAFELEGLRLEERRNNPVLLALHVAGISDPLRDPRMPKLIASIADYRSALSVAVLAERRSSNDPPACRDWRLVWSADQPIMFVTDLADDGQESSTAIGRHDLEVLCGAGRVLEHLFPRDEFVATHTIKSKRAESGSARRR